VEIEEIGGATCKNGDLALRGEVDAAVDAAADYLYQADMPLVYGLSNITCEAQRESVALAELIGGVVDSHTSL